MVNVSFWHNIIFKKSSAQVQTEMAPSIPPIDYTTTTRKDFTKGIYSHYYTNPDFLFSVACSQPFKKPVRFHKIEATIFSSIS